MTCENHDSRKNKTLKNGIKVYEYKPETSLGTYTNSLEQCQYRVYMCLEYIYYPRLAMLKVNRKQKEKNKKKTKRERGREREDEKAVNSTKDCVL